jgi:predicted RNase H-like HicB family nuclease
MKTLIQIYKEGKFFVAVDLITNVADQGLSEEEALANLKKGLEEHYQILLEMAPKGRKVSFLDIELAEMSFSLLFRKSNSSFSETGGNPPSRCTDAAGTRDSKIWSSRTNRM